MSNSPLPVLVAGAGPSGLVAALTLLRNNIPVRIIEKEPIHRIGQRGPGIFPRSLELFHFLEVPEVDAVSKPIPLIQAYKPNSVEPLKSYPMSPYTEPTPAFPIFNPKMIGQQTLEAILRSHLEKQGCFVELGSELRSFEQNDDRVVAHIIKKQGDEEVTETIEASFLIGTDGARGNSLLYISFGRLEISHVDDAGVTRKQLGLSFLGETRDDLHLVMGDIRLAGKGIDRVHWHQFGEMNHSMLMLRPTDEFGEDGFQYMVLSPNSQIDLAKLATDKDALFQTMRDFTGTEIEFKELIWVSEFRPNIRMVDNFGKDRVFVAGDAAHVHSPTGGQGLNSSVQDAFNLSWKLSLVYKGISPASLLSTYTTERIPVIAEMLNLTTVLLNKTVGRTEATAESAFERGQRLYMLGVNYRFSPIVVDEFSDAGPVDAYGLIQNGVLIAGDRAPDAPKLVSNNGNHTRLFNIFRPAHHTVLVFAPDTASVTPIISALGRYAPDIVRPVVVLPSTAARSPNSTDTTTLVDEGGYAYGGYLVKNGETRVVIVRPDGVVGAIVAGEHGVKKYFDLVFAL
ncbi:hypothetical protein BJ138DRAFT_1178955 [Hygrophoropsis aurantiaca]|uniref:Uncharacterized protein n=1 Tax=Hygrophoropsis aurantiaca TaxID=72124 RepID=A0ACB8AHY4_9AGAM|nr:hypothetical protein BJ138DRAFT_1178955 [Hygrophoropsis aurantiaca]